MFDNDQYIVTKLDGSTGPTWTCDDLEEAEALLDEHGYTLLYSASGAGEPTKLVVA